LSAAPPLSVTSPASMRSSSRSGAPAAPTAPLIVRPPASVRR
jgi:hypothetical protein